MWMQRRGLEWLFRLATEPRRLWKRYLITNTQYLARLTGALLTPRARRNSSRGATSRTFTQDM
jgi:N-acetylglucosaminyldiphosphoundecaprenol N-acetyl-beta-D-mannosaminyltransferase